MPLGAGRVPGLKISRLALTGEQRPCLEGSEPTVKLRKSAGGGGGGASAPYCARAARAPNSSPPRAGQAGPKMAALRYRRFLKLCEEWPVDETKRGRDLGAYLRQRVAQAFREGENTQVTGGREVGGVGAGGGAGGSAHASAP